MATWLVDNGELSTAMDAMWADEEVSTFFTDRLCVALQLPVDRYGYCIMINYLRFLSVLFCIAPLIADILATEPPISLVYCNHNELGRPY